MGELRLIKEVVEPEEAERSVGRRMSARDRYVIASAEEPARLTLHVAQPTSLRYNAFKPFSYYVRG